MIRVGRKKFPAHIKKTKKKKTLGAQNFFHYVQTGQVTRGPYDYMEKQSFFRSEQKPGQITRSVLFFLDMMA